VPVLVEADAVGRVEIDALNLALEPLALGEACHHREAVAEDHAVRQVRLMLIKLGRRVLRHAVEIGEQVGRLGAGILRFGRSAAQIVDNRLRVDLFLNV
jgi:hypothetical protein